jgi:hypothetical protein
MPYLSEANIAKQRQFAEYYQHWEFKQWGNAIWSDKTMICRFGRPGKEMVWKCARKKKKSDQYRKTMKHGRGSVRIWGRMTIHGVGSMVRILKHVDQHLYKEILAKALPETMAMYGMVAKNVAFQHDNDPKHTAKTVKEWLSKQLFKVLE